MLLAKRSFGVSTRLYGSQRLRREHLLEIASFGFEVAELYAAPGHVDCRNATNIADLQQWLAEARLELHTVAVPAPDTVEQIEPVLHIARRIPFKALIVQATTPRQTGKLVDTLAVIAAPLGVTVTVDSASMPPIGSVTHFVENAEARVGIALDLADAQRQGDLLDAIETAAEHVTAVRVPIDTAIDWAAVLTTIQKVGYEGPLVFDLSSGGPPKDRLRQARTAREQMERLFRRR